MIATTPEISALMNDLRYSAPKLHQRLRLRCASDELLEQAIRAALAGVGRAEFFLARDMESQFAFSAHLQAVARFEASGWWAALILKLVVTIFVHWVFFSSEEGSRVVRAVRTQGAR